ncbi:MULTISPECIES: MFS transporter [Cupriavidus]|uniref:MFS transporter n=1 Tax=Cupriavidus TaxID=106589 RepID=UPI00039EA2C6|nr:MULTISPECIES: MFS transporter [Cupriavidus]
MAFRRGWVLLFLFLLTTINYMDRVVLSVAAKPIAAEFHLSPVSLGYLFSSFIWTYTLFLIPMGQFVDRFGTRRVAAAGIGIWSLATILTGAASTYGLLLASRLVMGAGESSSNPVCAKTVRQWIPARERGAANAVFNAGSFAGPAFCLALIGVLISAFGWRWAFVISGSIGFVWLALWMVFFNTPERTRWLSQGEREMILRERNNGGQALDEGQPDGLLRLLHSRTLWGIALTEGCNIYAQYLFLTWLPSYLQSTRHVSITSSGWLSGAPYGGAVVLAILAGFLSDRYVRGAGVASGRRRHAIAVSMLCGAAILLVPLATSFAALVAVLTLSLSGIAATNATNFSLLSDMLPNQRDIAKAMGFVIVGGNVFGLLAPIVTGYVISMTGSYDYAFVIAGVLLLTGIVLTLTMTHRPIVARAAAKLAQA